MDDKLQKLLEADILNSVGLSDASPDIKESALTAAKNHILRAVVRRIHNQLSPELREKFEQLFGVEDEIITEEDMEFLKNHVPDLDALLFEETLAFKKGVMDASEEIKRKSADESEKINGILNKLTE